MASSSSGHLYPQVLPRPLVDVVGDGDGGGHLAEVGDDAAVEAGEALGAPDVAEEAEHVRLLGGQVEVLAGLALQLGAHQRQRVGGHLPAAAGPSCLLHTSLVRKAGTPSRRSRLPLLPLEPGYCSSASGLLAKSHISAFL